MNNKYKSIRDHINQFYYDNCNIKINNELLLNYINLIKSGRNIQEIENDILSSLECYSAKIYFNLFGEKINDEYMKQLKFLTSEEFAETNNYEKIKYILLFGRLCKYNNIFSENNCNIHTIKYVLQNLIKSKYYLFDKIINMLLDNCIESLINIYTFTNGKLLIPEDDHYSNFDNILPIPENAELSDINDIQNTLQSTQHIQQHTQNAQHNNESIYLTYKYFIDILSTNIITDNNKQIYSQLILNPDPLFNNIKKYNTDNVSGIEIFFNFSTLPIIPHNNNTPKFIQRLYVYCEKKQYGDIINNIINYTSTITSNNILIIRTSDVKFIKYQKLLKYCADDYSIYVSGKEANNDKLYSLYVLYFNKSKLNNIIRKIDNESKILTFY